MSIQLQDGLLNQSKPHVLEDLLVRFVVNAPDEDLSSIERIFFQVEEAQWFYTDFVRQLNPYLPHMKMKSFAPALLEMAPLVWRWGDAKDALPRFGQYKSTIPVRGVALLNKDLTKIVLVTGKGGYSWSFPRGKISKDESDIECAIREVREETSFDARDYVNEKDVLERTVHGKNFKIYLAKGVPEDFPFEPLVRQEISEIKWFDIKTLQKSTRSSPQKFFITEPFMKPMTQWINKNKGVVNVEQLKREAEAQLKSIMGIGGTKVNPDAGRELLNILQGAPQQKTTDTSQDSTMSMQNHLNPGQPSAAPSNFAPQPFMPQGPHFLQNLGQMLPPPNLLPPQYYPQPHSNPVPQPQHLHHPQLVLPQQFRQLDSFSSQPLASPPVEPSAKSLGVPKKVSHLANSKEFLSLLKRDSKPAKQEKAEHISSEELKQINRSRAQELLSVFNKSLPEQSGKEKPASNNSTPVAASVEPVLPASVSQKSPLESRSETPKKFTLLKRGKEKDASATLMDLLGKKASSEERSPSTSSATSNRQTSEGSYDTKSQTASLKNASADLLGLLKRTPKQPSEELSQEKNVPVEKPQLHSSNNNNESPRNELLEMLQPKKNIRIAKKDDEASATLNNILHLNQGANQKLPKEVPGPILQNRGQFENQVQNHQTDPSIKAGEDIINLINKDSATPEVQAPIRPTPKGQSDFSEFENFEDCQDFDNVNDLYQSIANTIDDDDDDEDGYLKPRKEHSGHADADQFMDASQFPRPTDLQGIYGYTSSSTEQQPFHLPQQTRSNSNGADLLSILKRKPQSPPTSQTTVDSGRKELLSLLKRYSDQ